MRDHRESSNCTFCELIHGAGEVSICHEDSDAIAFMDIQPVNNGHVLVVPRDHYESLLDVPPEIGGHLFNVTMRLAAAVRRVTGCDAMNIVVNSGVAAGQDEPHYHVHIIPRREGDGFGIPLPFDGSQMPDRTVLDAYAARIIADMRDPVRTDHASHDRHMDQHEHANEANRANAANYTEAPVALPTFNESATQHASDTHRDDVEGERWQGLRARISEGAHGELRYESDDTSIA